MYMIVIFPTPVNYSMETSIRFITLNRVALYRCEITIRFLTVVELRKHKAAFCQKR